jgi:glycosyltransferase involved in cell wall biosynthesis
MTRLLQDTSLRERMSEQARRYVFAEYDESRIAAQFEAMYAKGL